MYSSVQVERAELTVYTGSTTADTASNVIHAVSVYKERLEKLTGLRS